MGTRRTRVRRAMLAAATAALLLPAAASAGSKVEFVSLVPISRGYAVTIKAQPGEANNVTVGDAGGFPNDYRITDTAGIRDPLPPGCVRESATSIRCPKEGLDDPSLGPLPLVHVTVFLGDGDDLFTPGTGGLEGIELFIEAGEGDDTIIGHSGGGVETIQGGPGNDSIFTGEPADNKELDGGTGNDKITVGVNGAPPPGAFATGQSKGGAEIRGMAGRDRITGSAGPDRISGGSGNDKLKGRGGRDKLICGGGKDKAIGGGGADVARGCEKAKGI